MPAAAVYLRLIIRLLSHEARADLARVTAARTADRVDVR
jgi:hypothetical protein